MMETTSGNSWEFGRNKDGWSVNGKKQEGR